eukprot:GEMP01005741.1.p1 GENE.GEMP01005741.1~~GEMP01005741.1.p1  ORF type:complete len:728 (+),score=89.63 GEMP01005741.1:327-2510(+)
MAMSFVRRPSLPHSTSMNLPLSTDESNTKKKPMQRAATLRSSSILVNPTLSSNLASRLTNSDDFQNAILVVIVLNSAWIGFDIEYNPVYQRSTPFPQAIFIAGDNIFTALFFGEIMLRFWSYTRWQSFFVEPLTRAWNWFDSILVIMMVTESWLIPLILLMSGNDEEVQVPRALQPLRLLRLLRITRIFQLLPELGMMVKSMVAALRSVSSTFTLAVCIMYVFSIIFTGWFLALDEDDQCIITKNFDKTDQQVCFNTYFGTIPFSLMTCFQLLIFDDTFALIRPAFEKNLLIGFLLILFLSLAAFTVLNMLIGVICEIVGTTTAEEKEKLLKARVIHAFNEIDCDASGTIDRAEFDGAARQLLVPLGLDENLVTRAFDVIDMNSSGELELTEFISTVFKMLHPPQSVDLLLMSRKLDKLSEYLGFVYTRKLVPGRTSKSNAPQGRGSVYFSDASPMEKKDPAVVSLRELRPPQNLQSALTADSVRLQSTMSAPVPESPEKTENPSWLPRPDAAIPSSSSEGLQKKPTHFEPERSDSRTWVKARDLRSLISRKISVKQQLTDVAPLASTSSTLMSPLHDLIEQQARILASLEAQMMEQRADILDVRKRLESNHDAIMMVVKHLDGLALSQRYVLGHGESLSGSRHPETWAIVPPEEVDMHEKVHDVQMDEHLTREGRIWNCLTGTTPSQTQGPTREQEHRNNPPVLSTNQDGNKQKNSGRRGARQIPK